MGTTGLLKMPIFTQRIAAITVLMLGLNPVIGYCTDRRVQKIDELMERFQSERYLQGAVLIAENGGILYEKAFGMAKAICCHGGNVACSGWRTPSR